MTQKTSHIEGQIEAPNPLEMFWEKNKRIVQFGLVGRDAVNKMFSVGTDMNLAGPVKTPAPGGLVETDRGYLGVCFGHRSFVGSGVWIGPGRIVPEDARLVRPPELMVLKPDQQQLGPS